MANNGDGSLSNAVLDSVETFVSNIVSGEITDVIINTLIIVVLIVWVYLGLKIFLDARVRYRIGVFGQILFLVFGVITGPIGLFLYNLTKPKYTPEELEFIKIEHKFYHHQASKVLDCIKCKAYVLEDHAYCTNCGTQNRFKCESCGNLTDFDDKYCYSCGIEFKGRKEKILRSVGVVEEKKEIDNSNSKKDLSQLFNNLKENVVKAPPQKTQDTTISKPQSAKSDFANSNTIKDENKDQPNAEPVQKSVNQSNKNKKRKKKKKH